MAADLDVPMNYAAVEKCGSRLGTGAVIVLDQRTCPVGMLRNLEHFFAQESCGWCTPCRDGLPWVERLLAGLEAGEGEEEDLAILEEHVGLLAIESRRVAIERTLADVSEFTPVGVATLLLIGNDILGEDWFRRAKLSVGIS